MTRSTGSPGLTAVAPTPVQVSIRATPGVEAHTHLFVMTGQEDSKFGFSVASGAADLAIERLRGIDNLVVDGVHAHIGSQIFRLDAYEQEIAVLAPLLVRHGLTEFSVGGGIGVAYLNGERTPSITEWGSVVHRACRDAGVPEPRVEIGAEPGRAIVAGAAMTCYTVGTIKPLPGLRTYVAVDGGMSDNPRPVLYGAGYEAYLPERALERSAARSARIVGKHCESWRCPGLRRPSAHSRRGRRPPRHPGYRSLRTCDGLELQPARSPGGGLCLCGGGADRVAERDDGRPAAPRTVTGTVFR